MGRETRRYKTKIQDFNMTVFVIMASYLGEYPGCAKNREEKFTRAVNSFLCNVYPLKKLIIVSDGCEKTNNLYKTQYSMEDSVVCLAMPKQPLFSGAIRNRGIEYVKGVADPMDIICYLDTDDSFGKNHLRIICDNFETNDFVIYDTYRSRADGLFYHSAVAMQAAHIGTSSFAHRTNLEVSWPTGYGHDWRLLESLSKKYKYSKIPMCEYYIHHTPASDI